MTRAQQLENVARRIVEGTRRRPGFAYVLVDAELLQQLGDLCDTQVGRKSRGTVPIMKMKYA